MLDEYFADFPESRLIFDALAKAAAEELGAVEVRVSKSQVALVRGTAFAWAWVADRYLHGQHAPLVLSLALRRRDSSQRWKQVVEVRPGRFMHHLEIWSASEIDVDVLRWLAEAAAEAKGEDSR